jgi:hypothetical protein
LRKKLPYGRRDGLLSAGELAFYRVLRRAVGGRYSISIKTRLADVVKCPDDLWDEPEGRRVSQKHVDFILYDPWTSGIVAVVELDDRSHDEPQRRRRDRFLNEALSSAGVVLVRVKAARRYDAQLLRDLIERATDAGSEGTFNLEGRVP